MSVISSCLGPKPSSRALTIFATALLSASAFAQSTTPTAAPGYTLSVFTTGVVGDHTKPDSIAIFGQNVYIAYGNGNDPTGADGKSNKIIEYNRLGQIVYSFSVKGHNDGLKVNPYTNKLWVLQNEDANPNLVVFDTVTRQQQLYTFASAPAGGGGYDDITFTGGKAYISASNPSHNPNTEAAIVEAKLVGSQVVTTPIFRGNPTVVDITTGKTVTLNLQDPDSLTVTPSGDLLLDSQGDSELVMVRMPGTNQQSGLVLPLSSPYGQPQVDDTAFAPSTNAVLLVSDTAADIVYKITKTSLFVPGTPYSAGVAGTTAAPGLVGLLDLQTGQLTPIASGLQSPHGEAFVSTSQFSTTQSPLAEACKVLSNN